MFILDPKRDYKVAFVRCYYKENRITVSQNSKSLLFARSKTILVKYSLLQHYTEQNLVKLHLEDDFELTNTKASHGTWTRKKCSNTFAKSQPHIYMYTHPFTRRINKLNRDTLVPT